MSHWNFKIAGNHKTYFEIAGIPAFAGRFASLLRGYRRKERMHRSVMMEAGPDGEERKRAKQIRRQNTVKINNQKKIWMT